LGGTPSRIQAATAVAQLADLPAAWRRLFGAGLPAAEPAGVLGFLLELNVTDGQAAAELDVAPVLLSALGNGRYARPLPLDARHLAASGLGVAQQRLASSLLGLPQIARKGRSYARLAGALGDALLTEMLDSAPCLFGGVAGLHMQRGASLPLHWHWLVESDGRQRLQPQLRPGQRLLRVGALWVLDAEQASLLALDADASAAALLDLPALPPEVSGAFGALLPATRWAAHIPAPRAFDAVARAELSPKPVLTLHALTRHARLAAGTPPLAYARLSFDYGGERLPGRGGEGLVRRVREGKLVEIARRRAEELATMERLEAAGLTPAVDTEGLPWDLADTLPEDAWLFPGTGHVGALEVNTPARWLALRARLEVEGVQFDYAPSFPFEVLEGAPQWYGVATPERDGQQFALEVGLEIEGQRVNLLPAVAQALAERQISLAPAAHEPEDAVWYAPVDARRRIPVRLAALRALLAPLAEYLDRPRERLLLPRVQAGRLAELRGAMPAERPLDAPAELAGFTQRLLRAAAEASDIPPETLRAELRGYQREGLRWMNALAEADLGGVLADDMGLGKTVQLLAHLLVLKARGALNAPALLVVPTSLIPNWEQESARFAPTLRVLTLHGAQRGERFAAIPEHDVVLTTYALLPRDVSALHRQPFALAVLDEAQQVKNPRTRARRALKELGIPRVLALTGTPLENHLGELWAQIDLTVPGLLGDEHSFRKFYRQPIEKQGEAEAQARLNRRIAPFILRRTKAQVARELPAKTEITRNVRLEGRQRELYEGLRLSLTEELRQVIAQRGIEHSGIVVLDALLKLRQVCCDPRLVKLEAARGVQESAKLELLMDMLPALVDEGRSILLFSQFTSMLALIGRELERLRIPYLLLTGDTRDRATPVRRFQAGEVPLFLLSLKAGGVGLNLTAADTVIHYDPWWNPAAEAQAVDRAHRIGQDKPVFVYRLVAAGTVEERIEALKQRKAALAEAVLEGGGTREKLSFGQDDLDLLLAPPPGG
jgi:superfamily II DNA or RNA helicase